MCGQAEASGVTERSPRLQSDLDQVQARVRELEADNTHLRALLALTPASARRPPGAQSALYDAAPGSVTATSSASDKVAFYRSLFACRRDVYAVRWDNRRTGAGGWVPAVRGGFRRGMRPADRQYLPLTEQVLTSHLSGDLEIGLYPLLDNDRCHWLAADFDGPTALLDALSYLKAARAHGIPAAAEVSRSGAGAHVWIFFAAAVPASQARQLGTGLLREAMTLSGRMSLSSYDRLFPSQDLLPAGGIGNLIAAPLSGHRRKSGTTAFLDLATLEPVADQWDYLSGLPRLTPAELVTACRRLGTVATGTAVARMHHATATRIQVAAPRTINVTLGAQITVHAAGLTPALLATLRHAASLANPAFYDRERRRQSTWDTPRFLRLYDETPAGDLLLPRGMLERLDDLIRHAGSQLNITMDKRTSGSSHPFTCAVTLREEQRAAVDALRDHDLGVLVAPPGAGKTIMAADLIAHHSVATLVLVDRKALADQWRQRLLELLGVKPGQRGAGRSKTSGILDIATLQTLARDGDLASWTGRYGLVIVDECHHVPAAAFTDALRQLPARRWLGLTATPYRRDQLDQLIHLQLGPIRHTVTPPQHGTLTTGLPAPEPVLHLHPTDYVHTGTADPQQPGGMAAIYRDLIADPQRLTQITDDVVAARAQGRHCLLLTQWTRHLDAFAAALTERGHPPVTLKGGMAARARRAALNQLDASTADRPLLVLATGSYIGEGFDCPALDTLFLAAPIAFKGRLVQYAGRILRPHPDKTTAVVHDYHDQHVPVLASSLNKRAPGYLSLGFPDPR